MGVTFFNRKISTAVTTEIISVNGFSFLKGHFKGCVKKEELYYLEVFTSEMAVCQKLDSWLVWTDQHFRQADVETHHASSFMKSFKIGAPANRG